MFLKKQRQVEWVHELLMCIEARFPLSNNFQGSQTDVK